MDLSKKIIKQAMAFFLVFNLLFANNRKLFAADVDPRLMVVGSLALYGTIGGALLGAASLAYNTKPRAIAMGASIGLYVGLLFGGYIVLSHHYLQSSQNVKSGQNSLLTGEDNAGEGDNQEEGEEEVDSQNPPKENDSENEVGDEGKKRRPNRASKNLLDKVNPYGLDKNYRQELFFASNSSQGFQGNKNNSAILFYVPIIELRF